MSDRTYYVLCGDNCKFEGMTKEQIIAAIAEATGEIPISVDDAFITKIKEKNHNASLKFWVGTNAQYNALTPESDVFYIIKDADPLTELAGDIEELEEDITEINNKFSNSTSGDWRIVSVNGEIDLYYSGTLTNVAVTSSWGAVYQSSRQEISLPSNIITDVDFATVSSAHFVWPNGVSANSSAVGFYISAHTSTTIDTLGINIHVHGRKTS